MKRITKISVIPTALFVGVVSSAMVFLAMLFVAFFNLMEGDGMEGLTFQFITLIGMTVFIPIIYGGFGFVSTALACVVYNYFSRWAGGIEVEITRTEQEDEYKDIIV